MTTTQSGRTFLGVKAGAFADIHHPVVLHAGASVARPVDILVHLRIGDGAAGILRDAEGLGEAARVKEKGVPFSCGNPFFTVPYCTIAPVLADVVIFA